MAISENELAKQKSQMKEILEDQQYFKSAIAAFKKTYEALEIGSFSENVLREVGAQGIEGIVKQYLNAMSDEVDASGIKSTRMRAMLLQSCDEAVHDLRVAYNGMLAAVQKRTHRANADRINKIALTYQSCGFNGKIYGWSNEPGRIFKRLLIGHNSWVQVKEGNRSWGLEWSEVRMEPGKGDIHLYARVPKMGSENGKLEVHYKTMPNTDSHYMVLILQKPYEEIDFNY